mgnify:CR=1 FL=1
MFSHIMVGANDIAASKTFYDAVLGALGIPAGMTDDKGRVFYLSPAGIFAIVNIIADMWQGMPTMGHSGAARAGMLNFTETAAFEWAPVRVNAVAPGWIASSGMDHYPPEMAEHIRSLPGKAHPRQRMRGWAKFTMQFSHSGAPGHWWQIRHSEGRVIPQYTAPLCLTCPRTTLSTPRHPRWTRWQPPVGGKAGRAWVTECLEEILVCLNNL